MSNPDRRAAAAAPPDTGTRVTAFTKVTRDAAIAALAAAATHGEDGTGPATVLCATGDIITPWLLTAAHAMIDVAQVVIWAPDLAAADGYGLAACTAEGGLYRFATDPPATVPARPRLHIVREAS